MAATDRCVEVEMLASCSPLLADVVATQECLCVRAYLKYDINRLTSKIFLSFWEDFIETEAAMMAWSCWKET